MKNTLFLIFIGIFLMYNNISAEQRKIAFITTYSSLTDLQNNGDDDEIAAANWFVNMYPSPEGTVISTQDATNWDLGQYNAIWIAIDRIGVTNGLPSEFTTSPVLDRVKNYYQSGGNLLLTNHATRYLVDLERTTRLPGIFGNGAGGNNSDDWGVNAIIGSTYDHSADFLYTGMITNFTEGTAKKVYSLIGNGWKEDHNSMWDLNSFGYSGTPNVVANFETENNATVLGTWQHVIDFCCAGIVDFKATSTFGRCIAIGLAAYEWNQNDKTNAYQSNIEIITINSLNELAPSSGTATQIEMLKNRAQIIDIKILTTNGVLVKTKNIQSLVNGIYIVKEIDELGNVYTNKVIVNK